MNQEKNLEGIDVQELNEYEWNIVFCRIKEESMETPVVAKLCAYL